MSSADPKDLAIAGPYLFFAATNPYHGRELFFVHYAHGLIDGVGNFAEVSYIDIVPGEKSSDPAEMSSANGEFPLLFQANDHFLGTELWITSDGVSASILYDICVGPGSSNPRYITYFREKFFFQADDCVHGNAFDIRCEIVSIVKRFYRS